MNVNSGDLADVSHRLAFLGRLHLLPYEVDEDAKSIYIYAVGGHENFYCDLKQHLKS